MQSAARHPEIDIGARLREARTARRLSQRELARRAGVTNGMISLIEQNHSSPSVSSLKRILEAIPMSLAEFFADEALQAPGVVYRAADLRELNPSKIFGKSEGADSISLRQVGNSSNHSIQMLHETYAPGADTGAEKYAHQSEEAGIVVSGQIELTVGDATAILGPGDAYLFDSRIPHRFRNPGDQDCVIVSACTPPSF